MSLRTYAEAYAHAGLSVHPLPPGEKKSRLPWGERQRVAMSEKAVKAHWTERPDDNIAIITGQLSGLVVVDVDPTHGGDPKPFAGTTPAVVMTRSGGWHFYYRHPGPHVKSCAGPNPDLPGVDVRGDGGYVVAPPSKVDPGQYTWARGSHLHFISASLPGFETVEHLIFPKREGHVPEAAPGEIRFPEGDQGWLVKAVTMGAPEGSQRQTLLQLAGYFAGKAIPSDIAYAFLFSWVCRQKQKPGDPWQPRHVRDIVESIYDREAKARAVDPTGGPEHTTAGAEPAAQGSAVGDALRLRPVQLDAFMERWEGQRATWLVEDWVPQATIAMVQSPPGSFKTWLLFDLALSVAMGEPFLGRYPVHQPGPVLVIQQEDPEHLIAQRLGPLAVGKYNAQAAPSTASQFGWPIPHGVPLYLLTGGDFNFGVPDARRALHRRIDELRPSLVVMDPLYTMCPSGQFFQEMPTHFQFLKWLRNKYGTSFLIAHHTKKVNHEAGDQGREQMWGSNLMNAAIESGWIVRPAGEKSVTIRRHFKVSANFDRRKFDFDIDVNRVPALICTESDLDDPAVVEAEKDQLNDLDQLVLAYLRTEGDHTIGEIATKVGKPQPTVSRRVRGLVDKGLVVRRSGKGKGAKLGITTIKTEEVT